MAVYQGNKVAYGSGAHWYVQVVVTDAGSNTGTTTTVYYTYQVVFSHSIVDSNNTINWSDPWGTGSRNNFSFNGAGTYTISGTHSAPATIVYGGGNKLRFRMYATGMAGGATGPSVVEFDYPLPGRAGKSPDAPTMNADAITDTSARVYTSKAGAENGATTTKVRYQVRLSSNDAVVADFEAGYAGKTVTGLIRNTNYKVRGRSYNAFGWGGWSAYKTFKTRPSKPAKPGTPTVLDLGPLNVTLKWANVDNGGSAITSWQYQMSELSNYSGEPLTGIPFDNTGATLTRTKNLTPGTKYYVRARALNAEGAGPWSNSFVVETLAGGWMNIDGTWKLVIPYVNVNGTWKMAIPYKNINGTWRPVSG